MEISSLSSLSLLSYRLDQDGPTRSNMMQLYINKKQQEWARREATPRRNTKKNFEVAEYGENPRFPQPQEERNNIKWWKG